jgi:hypothetical protein
MGGGGGGVNNNNNNQQQNIQHNTHINKTYNTTHVGFSSEKEMMRSVFQPPSKR